MGFCKPTIFGGKNHSAVVSVFTDDILWANPSCRHALHKTQPSFSFVNLAKKRVNKAYLDLLAYKTKKAISRMALDLFTFYVYFFICSNLIKSIEFGASTIKT